MESPPFAEAILRFEFWFVVLLAVALGDLKWSVRIPLAALLGWPVVAIATALFWRVLFDSARTPAEVESVAAHDGGPVTFAALFGWVYALVIVLEVEVVRALVRHVGRKVRERMQQSSGRAFRPSYTPFTRRRVTPPPDPSPRR